MVMHGHPILKGPPGVQRVKIYIKRQLSFKIRTSNHYNQFSGKHLAYQDKIISPFTQYPFQSACIRYKDGDSI